MFLFITKLRPSQSANKPIQIHLMFLFIIVIMCSVCNDIYSNTSHVLIYHRKVYHALLIKFNSNTSHVLIYPGCADENSESRGIQIHLMFLFITEII